MIMKNAVDKLAGNLSDELRKLFYDLRKGVLEFKNIQERLIPNKSYRDFVPGYFIKRKELFRVNDFSFASFLVSMDITNKLEFYIMDESGISGSLIESIKDAESKNGIKIVHFFITNKKEVKSLLKIIELSLCIRLHKSIE